jgi:hypothetical protein
MEQPIPKQIRRADDVSPDQRNTGDNTNYYLVEVKQPKRLDPYTAECEDIIEALGMNFAEGCAFKAIWRRCAAKKLGVIKKNYDGPAYDGEKTVYYGQRMVAQDKREAMARDAGDLASRHVCDGVCGEKTRLRGSRCHDACPRVMNGSHA